MDKLTKRLLPYLIACLFAMMICFGQQALAQTDDRLTNSLPQETSPATKAQKKPFINPEGMTVETRFLPPHGFERKKHDDPYVAFMRTLPMLPDGSPVLYFDGRLKPNQAIHIGVLDIDVGKRDLQQCADAALRLRGEYLYHSGQGDKIAYHLSNGFLLSWPEWQKGFRLKYDKNKKPQTWMEKTASPSNSYETFRKYLDALFMYAGVNSVMKESRRILLSEIQPGDVFASTGHLIIVLDVVQNAQGQKRFLLAQSYMPAQQIEVLINPFSPDGWYDASTLIFPFITPEWIFPAPGPNLFRMP